MDPVIPLTPAQTAVQEKQAASNPYIMRVLIAADMLANVTLGGQEDETISSDTALMARKHEFIGSLVSKMLDLVQKNHGAGAVAGDEERAQAEAARLAASGVINA